MNDFNQIFNKTNEAIESDLRVRGEVMRPGNPEFDALVQQIAVNRKDRESYEQAMSTPIRHWTMA